MRIAFFEVLYVEITEKLQILKISLIFSDFLVDFNFRFMDIYVKNLLKKK